LEGILFFFFWERNFLFGHEFNRPKLNGGSSLHSAKDFGKKHLKKTSHHLFHSPKTWEGRVGSVIGIFFLENTRTKPYPSMLSFRGLGKDDGRGFFLFIFGLRNRYLLFFVILTAFEFICCVFCCC